MIKRSSTTSFPEIIKTILIVVIGVLLSTCNSRDTLPKPKAFLRLAYDDSNYQKMTNECPYIFELSDKAKVNPNSKCWMTIQYPNLKASLNITYRPVENNLRELFLESEKLTYKHSIKADGISAQPYENKSKRVYGSLLEVTGNAASPLQFHLTDSTKHFITGALYFEVQPNYDSILPAIKHVERDIKHLMETLEWKN